MEGFDEVRSAFNNFKRHVTDQSITVLELAELDQNSERFLSLLNVLVDLCHAVRLFVNIHEMRRRDEMNETEVKKDSAVDSLYSVFLRNCSFMMHATVCRDDPRGTLIAKLKEEVNVHSPNFGELVMQLLFFGRMLNI